jgi:hypothetical protein
MNSTDPPPATTVVPELPTAAEAIQMLTAAIGQIEFARRYTLELLQATPREHWFTLPNGLSTHVAWQVGHLTVSQYGLLMFRLRGRKPEDLELIPGRFRKAYGRQSQPSGDVARQPSIDQLLDRMADVHRRALAELARIDPQVLLEPVEMPYASYPIKLGAILFCPLHEHIHAGQIGLLRRSLGLEPIR